MNRWALAVILGYIAVFGVPKPAAPIVPAPNVSTPSTAMRAVVAPVTAAMKQASQADRNLFADLWVSVARVVEADSASSPLFEDTRALREYTRIAAVIGWNRLGGNIPGKYAGLDAACNEAFTSAMGVDQKAVDSAVRGKFCELSEALAWAALQR